MKVLLLQDVKSLGKAGQICEVKDGYGRNFLIAKGFGQLATNETINRYKSKEKKRLEEEAALIQDLKNTAKTLQNLTLKINKKVGANGSLYGAITKEEIVQSFKENHNIDIDKKALELKTPIKSTGIYELDLKLGFGIHAVCKIDIQAE
ncbi:50S ribosomal protein L9 [Helicobacter sp. MIT 14-3879]|uniref:50S ribosomal protein L9 n=1 Tax=Helicobacter sp. MIT 14-3879 TaxID=2040649 RepID=UPI000E1E6BA7|nr:50S ribosomal protein L9 [Helicobacter sp. MIT 14-3879]RDU65461.1 50S ribosomal protein L9 [Helicobacter sp. MIT 14-3879]